MNPNVRRSSQIAANMDAIVRSKDLIEHDLAELRADARVAHRHCTCAAKQANVAGATAAEHEAVLATAALHKQGCAFARIMKRELDVIAELRNANAALEAGAPVEVGA
jgi:hypothetical protein